MGYLFESIKKGKSQILTYIQYRRSLFMLPHSVSDPPTQMIDGISRR